MRSAWAAPSTWSEGWAEAEAAAQHAIEGALGRHAEVTEPGLARALYAWSPPSSTVVASSSMPVRDLEWFAAPRSDPPRVLANRGANGIDGVTSTTLGVTAAAGGTGGPVVGLIGDLAFLHDSTALVRGRREPALATVLVVVDNGGGGIFSFLPQASGLDEAYFERLFGTPQRIDVADLARAAGCDTIEVTSQQEVPEQLDAALVQRGPARPGGRRRAQRPQGELGAPHRARGRSRPRPWLTGPGRARSRRGPAFAPASGIVARFGNVEDLGGPRLSRPRPPGERRGALDAARHRGDDGLLSGSTPPPTAFTSATFSGSSPCAASRRPGTGPSCSPAAAPA